MKRESFIVYRSFRDALATASDADVLAAWRAMMDYALDGVEPEGLTGVAAVAWGFMRPQIDACNARYDSSCKGAEFGRLGGAPKGNRNAKRTKQPPGLNETTLKGLNETTPQGLNETTLNDTLNSNSNTNVNVNESVNESVNVIGTPSLQEIQDFVAEEGLKMDAKSFYDYYSARGWLIGKTPMADWRAGCRRWETLEASMNNKHRTAEPVGYEIGRVLIDNRPDKYINDNLNW